RHTSFSRDWSSDVCSSDLQVTTGEAWPDIAATVMEDQPLAWVFFLVFILVSTFVVLNLFLAVVVNAMESVREQEAAAQPAVPAEIGRASCREAVWSSGTGR